MPTLCITKCRTAWASLRSAPPYKQKKQGKRNAPKDAWTNRRARRGAAARSAERARLSAFRYGSHPRGVSPWGATPGQASWDADAIVIRQAGVTRPFLSQSSGSTPRTGRSTGEHDARSRSGAACKAARKHRTRSVFGCASRTRPLSERD